MDRAFRVEKMELAFLFDFFYAKYAAMLGRDFPSAKTAVECIALFSTVLIAVGLEVEATQIRSDDGHDMGIETPNRCVGHKNSANIMVGVTGSSTLRLLDFRLIEHVVGEPIRPVVPSPGVEKVD